LTTTCTGPNCGVLSKMPGFMCTNSSGTVSCSNQITCSHPSNFTTNVIVDQNDQNANVVKNNVSMSIANETFTTISTATATLKPSRAQKPKPFVACLLFILFVAWVPLAHAQAALSPAAVVDNTFSQMSSSSSLQGTLPGIGV